MSSPDLTGFLASGQPRSGRELCDPIDCRQVSTTETMAARAARLPRCRYRFDSFFYGKICTSGEVMYQHQHGPLPLEQLKGVPQPAVVLLEVLLEKDPSRRFQNPTELLKAISTITAALDATRRITRQSLQKTPSTASRVGTRKPPARLAPKKISVVRLPVTGRRVRSA